MDKEKIHLATISVLLKDRQNYASRVNEILTEHGHNIHARLGLNVQLKCTEHCTAVITVITEGTAAEISALTKKINDLYGVVAKESILE